MSRIKEIRDRLESLDDCDWSEDIPSSECEYFGDTLIMLADTYEDSDLDCEFVGNSKKDMRYLLNKVDELSQMLGEILECPSDIDVDTISSKGIWAAPEQVVYNYSIGLLRRDKARKILNSLEEK